MSSVKIKIWTPQYNYEQETKCTDIRLSPQASEKMQATIDDFLKRMREIVIDDKADERSHT